MRGTQQCFPTELEAPRGLHRCCISCPGSGPAKLGFYPGQKPLSLVLFLLQNPFTFPVVAALDCLGVTSLMPPAEVGGTGPASLNPQMLWKGICGTLGRTMS